MKSISGKRFCTLLERNQWILKRIKGSHYIYGKEGSDILVVVPVHKNQDLKPGLLDNLLKLSGINESEIL